jgi:hypothetical protein
MAAPRAMAALRTPPTSEEVKEEEQKKQEHAGAIHNYKELFLNAVSALTIPMSKLIVVTDTAQLEEKGGIGGSGGGGLHNMMHDSYDLISRWKRANFRCATERRSQQHLR